MSAGIRHLSGKGNMRGRVDDIETDSFNSIVERISGVNPTKLTQQALGQKSSAPPAMDESLSSAVAGAPTQGSPLQQTLGHSRAAPASTSGFSSDDANQQIQAMQDEINGLKSRISQYEGSNDAPYDRERASNHGYNSTVNSRDKDPKKKYKKDPADGRASNEPEPEDDPSKQEMRMSNETLKEIGLDSIMEWKRLSGVESPYVDLTESSHHVQPEIEDIIEGEVRDLSEAEKHDMFVEFLAAKDLTVSGYEAFVNEAHETGNEEDISMLLALEDEFNSVVEGDGPAAEAQKPAPMPGAPKPMDARKVGKAMGGMMKALGKGGAMAAKRTMSSSVHHAWREFLNENGVHLEDFVALCEQAEYAGDLELTNELLAFEAMFEDQIEEGRWPGIKAHQLTDPDDKSDSSPQQVTMGKDKQSGTPPPSASRLAMRARIAAVNKQQAAKAQGQSKPTELKMTKRIAGSNPASGGGSIQFPGKKPETFTSLKGKAASPKKNEDNFGYLLRNYNKVRLAEMDETEFEADCEPDGSPKIPWNRILKGYKVKMAASNPSVQAGKNEGGFGGMSRRGI